MNLTRHCTLCKNGITSLEKGMTCKLTKRKPDFEHTCPDINLGEKFQKKLERAILALESIRRHKRATYLSFFVLVITGIFLIVIGITLNESNYYTSIEGTNQLLYFWETKIGIIAIGGSMLAAATYKLSQFRRKFENAKHTKNKIDLVLDTYGIRYTYLFDMKERIHDTQHINLTLEFKNWTKKSTATSFVIDLKNDVHY